MNKIDYKTMILEAAHSYSVYMGLVPEGKLLKWAEVLGLATDVINNNNDETKSAFDCELANLVYEPIFVIASAIKQKLCHPDMPSDDNHLKAKNDMIHQVTIAQQRKESMDTIKNYDNIIEVKRLLIGAINRSFNHLNSIQDYHYPRIPFREEMVR